MRRSSSVVQGGKMTRRDSEYKMEVSERRLEMMETVVTQASVMESEYTSSASGTD